MRTQRGAGSGGRTRRDMSELCVCVCVSVCECESIQVFVFMRIGRSVFPWTHAGVSVCEPEHACRNLDHVLNAEHDR